MMEATQGFQKASLKAQIYNRQYAFICPHWKHCCILEEGAWTSRIVYFDIKVSVSKIFVSMDGC